MLMKIGEARQCLEKKTKKRFQQPQCSVQQKAREQRSCQREKRQAEVGKGRHGIRELMKLGEGETGEETETATPRKGNA